MKLVSFTNLVSSLVLAGFLSGCSTTQYQENTSEFFDNSLITAKCKTRLIDDRITGGHPIKVSTQNGVVYLIGYVNSDLQKTHAASVVSNVDGVKGVENGLVVRAAN